MDYVALMTFRPTADAASRDAALARRAGWHYPPGIRLINEYWPMAAGPQVVSIFATENVADVMSVVLEWNDVFDIDVHPAVAADEGLKVGADLMGSLQRMNA